MPETVKGLMDFMKEHNIPADYKIPKPEPRQASISLLAAADGLTLSRRGYQRYEGECEGKKVWIGSEDVALHGSFPANRRQRRVRVWRVKVDGIDIGPEQGMKSLREARQVALEACRPTPVDVALGVQASLSMKVLARAFHSTPYLFVELDHDRSGLGTHFGTYKAAVDRLSAIEVAGESYDRVLVYELNVKHPLVIPEDAGDWDTPSSVAYLLRGRVDLSGLTSTRDKKATFAYMRKAIEAAGYDSIAYKNDVEDVGQWSWIVWRSDLIKKVDEANAEGWKRLKRKYEENTTPEGWHWQGIQVGDTARRVGGLPAQRLKGFLLGPGGVKEKKYEVFGVFKVVDANSTDFILERTHTDFRGQQSQQTLSVAKRDLEAAGQRGDITVISGPSAAHRKASLIMRAHGLTAPKLSSTWRLVEPLTLSKENSEAKGTYLAGETFVFCGSDGVYYTLRSSKGDRVVVPPRVFTESFSPAGGTPPPKGRPVPSDLRGVRRGILRLTAVGRSDKEPWQLTWKEYVSALGGNKFIEDYGKISQRRPDVGEPYDLLETFDSPKGPVEIRRSRQSAQYTGGEVRTMPRIFAVVDGEVVGYVGDSFGATEAFVDDDFSRLGIGTRMLIHWRREYPKYVSGGLSAKGYGANKKVHRALVADALARGEEVPPEVLAEYPDLEAKALPPRVPKSEPQDWKEPEMFHLGAMPELAEIESTYKRKQLMSSDWPRIDPPRDAVYGSPLLTVFEAMGKPVKFYPSAYRQGVYSWGWPNGQPNYQEVLDFLHAKGLKPDKYNQYSGYVQQLYSTPKKRADLLPGGRADGLPETDFDSQELELGIEDEQEHTDDPEIAKEIAEDHLVKEPHYYSKHKGQLEQQGQQGQLLGTIQGIKILLVDGTQIRDSEDIDFTEGGNSARYGYIPEDEIWIEQSLPLEDQAATIIHEITEKHLMEGTSQAKTAVTAEHELERLVQLYEAHSGEFPLFVHFTDIEKIGINPQQKYKTTPLGIYGYPLTDSIMSQIESGTIPFRADAKYMYVLKVSDYANVQELDWTIDNDEDIEHYISTLTEAYPDSEEEIQEALGTSRVTYADLYALTFKLTKSNIVQWTALMRSLGLDGVTDVSGHGYIHENEPTQGVFFSISAFQVVALLDNPIAKVQRNDQELADSVESHYEYDPSSGDYDKVVDRAQTKKIVGLVLNQKKWSTDTAGHMKLSGLLEPLPKPELQQVFAHTNPWVVLTAAKVAAGHGWADVLSQPQLIHHADAKVREQVAHYGTDAARQELKHDSDIYVRRSVATYAKDPALLKEMQADEDYYVRWNAEKALQYLRY